MPGSNLHEEHIAVLAYEYWIERGCPFGSPEVDWYRAVETLSARAEEPEPLLLAAFLPGWNTAARAPRRCGSR